MQELGGAGSSSPAIRADKPEYQQVTGVQGCLRMDPYVRRFFFNVIHKYTRYGITWDFTLPKSPDASARFSASRRSKAREV